MTGVKAMALWDQKLYNNFNRGRNHRRVFGICVKIELIVYEKMPLSVNKHIPRSLLLKQILEQMSCNFPVYALQADLKLNIM